jgi:hypothetical protein
MVTELVMAGYGWRGVEALARQMDERDTALEDRWAARQAARPWRERLVEACVMDVEQAITRVSQCLVNDAKPPLPSDVCAAWCEGRPLTSAQRVTVLAREDARRTLEKRTVEFVERAAVSAAQSVGAGQ